jgi:hypothetical protein
MYKPFTYLVITYFPTYLGIYETYFLQNWSPRWNQISTNSVEVHQKLSNNGHPLDGALVGASSVCGIRTRYVQLPSWTRNEYL